jgi:hypothetical protein
MKNDGGPAFPEIRKVWAEDGSSWHEEFQKGMTLRDYFAGECLRNLFRFDKRSELKSDPGTVAERAYAFADAMLAERDK